MRITPTLAALAAVAVSSGAAAHAVSGSTHPVAIATGLLTGLIATATGGSALMLGAVAAGDLARLVTRRGLAAPCVPQ